MDGGVFRVGARETSKSVSGITSEGIALKIQCFMVGNEYDLALDVIPPLCI